MIKDIPQPDYSREEKKSQFDPTDTKINLLEVNESDQILSTLRSVLYSFEYQKYLQNRHKIELTDDRRHEVLNIWEQALERWDDDSSSTLEDYDLAHDPNRVTLHELGSYFQRNGENCEGLVINFLNVVFALELRDSDEMQNFIKSQQTGWVNAVHPNQANYLDVDIVMTHVMGNLMIAPMLTTKENNDVSAAKLKTELDNSELINDWYSSHGLNLKRGDIIA